MATVALAYTEVLDLVARGRDSAVYIQILRLGARLDTIVVVDACLRRIDAELKGAALPRIDVPTALENLDQLSRRLEANHRLIVATPALEDEARRMRAAHPEGADIPLEDWTLYAALLAPGVRPETVVVTRAPPAGLAGRIAISIPDETENSAFSRSLFDVGRDLRILCVTGGGYNGLFSARILARLEQTIRDRSGPGVRLHDVYGLYVGASIGAIVCAAIALGVPSRRIERFFRSRRVARMIFWPSVKSLIVSTLATATCLIATFVGATYLGFIASARAAEGLTPALAVAAFTALGMAMVALAVSATSLTFAGVQAPHLFRAKYRNTGLRRVIERLLGPHARTRLRDIHVPLAILATNANMARPHVFRSAGLDPNQPSDITVLDALMASAAAPTYFPAYRIGESSFVDGGLLANVADAIAVSDAMGRLYSSNLSTRMLSIGAFATDRTGGPTAPGAAGAFMWFARHNLLGKIFSAQEALAQSLAETLLDDRYIRIELAAGPNFGRHLARIDGHSRKARQSLLSLADRAWAREFEAIRRARLAG
jgi:predicted acylesterase/phospholipase RssA